MYRKKPGCFIIKASRLFKIKSAGDGTWTHTVLLPQAPEACASANSTTPANKCYSTRNTPFCQQLFSIFLNNFKKHNYLYFLQIFLKKLLTYDAYSDNITLAAAMRHQNLREIADMRKCWNWQTGKTKDLVPAMACGFKSHLPHYKNLRTISVLGFFVSIHVCNEPCGHACVDIWRIRR